MFHRQSRGERGERCSHGMFGRGRHEHGPGRGRLGRMFDHGDLRTVILQLITEKPRHGYEIIKAIEEQLAGAYTPSPGVVYPTLTMLEELGYTTTTTTSSKKLHTITPEGEAYLAANRSAVASILARIKEVREAHGGGPAPQILRAMENLKLALRMRLSRGPLTEEQIRRAAACIDAAATEIEEI
ncbi:MAG TPA: PadR family transcriptional regulator [Acetobacteraceae bacterium]|jgi:DNA-binding PadR family transcriptional regulator